MVGEVSIFSLYFSLTLLMESKMDKIENNTMARADEWLNKAIIQDAKLPNGAMTDRMLNMACDIENKAYANGERRNS